jgi:hypothetical protein
MRGGPDTGGEGAGFDAHLRPLAGGARMVFLAGLPGTGKSLCVHRLAHLGHDGGRTVHLLQWDVARPVFEASPGGRPYPLDRGVTHPVIRKAAGVWARHAVVHWHATHADARHLLIGETPLVGHRFIELARRADDDAEEILAAASCRFALPIPSVEVRRFIEAERGRRMASHLHDREKEDAPPPVVQEMWAELVRVSRLLGLDDSRAGAPSDYDPDLYERVYRRVLAHRRVESIPVRDILPGPSSSVYQFAVPTHDIAPTLEEASDALRAVEVQYPDPDELRRDVDSWFVA